MQQLTQKMKTGELNIIDVPQPIARDQFVIVRNHHSVISAGTEKSKLDLGKKSLLQKAKARPDLVKQVIKKVKNEGFWKTYQTVNQRLDEDSPLGYSTAGVVESVGLHVEGIRPGDRVACGGAGYANHAEYIAVPKHLAVKVPDVISLKEAAFTTIGSIALQGVRLAEPLLGERFLVIGLGLVGNIAAQLLKANGCQVIGFDVDAIKADLLNSQGMLATHDSQALMSSIMHLTQKTGVDGVLICAGTASNQPIEMAAELARSKARVVVVGAIGMQIPREPYFKKEISLVVSRSYGPGRYDPRYEEAGIDYPIDYVRFTEQRNMQTFLELLADKKITMSPLISHEYNFNEAIDAYGVIEGKSQKPYFGVVLNYELKDRVVSTTSFEVSLKPISGKINLSVIGAGNYVSSRLLPVLKSNENVELQTVMTSSGRTADRLKQRFDFKQIVGSADEALGITTDAVLIGTRHNSHAMLTIQALEADKAVFVEKPLALTINELKSIQQSIKPNSQFMIGFNRRFSMLSIKAKSLFEDLIEAPKVIHIRVNAGFLDADHWTQDPNVGGGRIIGEACHFVDLATFFAGALPTHVSAVGTSGASALLNDDVIITLRYTNGSVASITYTASGSPQCAKEYIEVFAGGRTAIINDFKHCALYKENNVKHEKLAVQDKGQKAMISAWISSLQKNEACVSAESLLSTSLATILAVHAIADGEEKVVMMNSLDEDAIE